MKVLQFAAVAGSAPGADGIGSAYSVVVARRLIHGGGYLSDLKRKLCHQKVTQISWSGFTVWPGRGEFVDGLSGNWLGRVYAESGQAAAPNPVIEMNNSRVFCQIRGNDPCNPWSQMPERLNTSIPASMGHALQCEGFKSIGPGGSQGR